MARQLRGESSIEFGDEKYTLVISLYAWALAQDALTRPGNVPSIEEIVGKLQNGSSLVAYAVFWAMLQDRHPDIETIDQAANVLHRCGEAGGKAMMNAIVAMNPDPADQKELNDGANPPKARAKKGRGTGASLS